MGEIRETSSFLSAYGMELSWSVGLTRVKNVRRTISQYSRAHAGNVLVGKGEK